MVEVWLRGIILFAKKIPHVCKHARGQTVTQERLKRILRAVQKPQPIENQLVNLLISKNGEKLMGENRAIFARKICEKYSRISTMRH